MNNPIPPASQNPEDAPHSSVKEDLPSALAPLYRSKAFAYLNGAGFDARSVLASAAAAAVVLSVALFFRIPWLGIPAALAAIALTGRVLWPVLKAAANEWIPRPLQTIIAAGAIAIFSLIGLLQFSGVTDRLAPSDRAINWDAVGALGETFGALGQILVAFLALYVAWRQYVISKDLTSQQNRITQQQTIDAYFQGISDLILDEDGLLEDWPPERAIAEGRTAAILTGLDSEGKAKIIRFLSSAKLLTPLKRDRRLGRPIFDGLGGYEEDIEYGVRVIDLTNMLSGTDLSNSDLRSTELSEANLSNISLVACDLTRANLSRALLLAANLRQADLSRTCFFHGDVELASPRDRINPPNYSTGAYTGAVIEGADFSQVKNLSQEQRYYCCAWGGSKTRGTIPGGCGDVPNKLGR
ncbi:pentapeptide repeat-containing protein [Altericista sp. CCNU0014]|uniref:pentapeptide repeat-containing protein n=1 Tax=Altericista sp. CCNU0014 TaxID=3082949 RepID=UPI0038507F9D